MTLSEQINLTHQTILVPTNLKYVGAPYESAVKEIVALVDDSNDEQTNVVHKCDLITNALRKSLSTDNLEGQSMSLINVHRHTMNYLELSCQHYSRLQLKS